MSIASLANDEILRTDRRNLDLGPIVAANLNPVIATLGLGDAAATQLRTAMRPVGRGESSSANPWVERTRRACQIHPDRIHHPLCGGDRGDKEYNGRLSVVDRRLSLLGLCWTHPDPLLLVYMGNAAAKTSLSFPQQPIQWPWWKLIACTVAFAFWALAVPPLVATEGGKVCCCVRSALISTLLSLIGAVVEPAPAPAAP